MLFTTSIPAPHSTYTPTSSPRVHHNTGLPYGSNATIPNTGYMPHDANVYSPTGGSIYGATRKLYDLPEFHGHPEQWPLFITAFRESTNAYGCTLLENRFRLQKSLKGIAFEEVESLLIDQQNVLQIIDQLEFKYGRPELLIKSQLCKIQEVTPVQENHLEKLVPYATKVQNLTTFLKSAKATQHLSNPTLMEELTSKLPMTKRMEWATYSSTIIPFPTVKHFNVWINQMARIIATVTPILPIVPMKTQPGKFRGYAKPVLAMNDKVDEDTRGKLYCVICNESHYIGECDEYLAMSISERWNIVKDNRLCFSFLRKGHNLGQCQRKKSSKISGCRKAHNATLHQGLNVDQVQVNTMQTKPIKKIATKLIFKVLPVELRGPNGKIVKVHAFLDEGSFSTLVEESVARQMGLGRKKESNTLQWIGGKGTKVSSISMQIKIKGAGNDKGWYKLNARSVPKLELPSQSIKLLSNFVYKLQNF